MGHKTIAETIRELEEYLLEETVRRDAKVVAKLLSDEFVEIGSSGKKYDKAIMIDALSRDPGFDGPRTITDFVIRELSETVILATYRVVESKTQRSSICRFEKKHWMMVFHQGTRM